ncbi:MAG: 50S ribosomal protein L18 [Bacillota bacterium]|jgi:large subunit ribosomal protein L18|nr:50S ribosomal protein L18 [Candidatus Fermentithermobacillaceae bacterium]
MAVKTKGERRARRHRRVRKKVVGTPERPRLNVFRSLKHIYAQIIDDTAGKTLVAASSCEEAFKETGKSGSNVDGAVVVGNLIARRSLEKNIKSVVFDRGGYRYRGRVKALAEGARQGGLEF